MNEFFGPGGVLEQKLGDYEFRPSQIRMAEAVHNALDSQGHVIIEAGTGTGKTLAYLLPALIHGQRIVVSTGTKTLQDQIFYKDIPLLERILERPIRSAYLKGRNNYLCRLKLETAHAEGLFSANDLRAFRKILAWSQITETGDHAELGTDIDGDLWSQLDARRDRCLGTKCVDYERCFLTLMRQKAMEADIVVVNHHLFFADLSIREADMGGILPDYAAVIFDEAHELEEIATEYFGFHVSNFRIGELVGDAKRLADRSETELEDLSSVQRASDRFFGGLALMREGRHAVDNFHQFDGMDALIGALQEARQVLKKQKDFSGEWEALERRAGEIAAELEVFRNGMLENYVSWIERRGRGLFLEACPVDVSGMLRERLFERLPACVLTSATLTVAESFGYFRQRIGLDAGEEMRLSTEFDVRNQAMLYVPQRMPDYRHPSYLNRAVEEIKNILNASRGRAFVLFTSYQQMIAAYEAISRDLPWPCLIQSRTAGKSRLLEEFKITPHAVLFATSSFWQGVDVKGEALSAVIIDKLPFQVPSDPLVSARMARVEREGGNAFSDYQLPHAILRLKQGLGRLIRSKSDRGILAILDNRLSTKGYGKLFMASLPDYRVTDSVEDLVEFMREEQPF
ncbi:MAG TPA: ATP-dependent DNA helicase [Terriglobia bacterium]|nr:ATP-dependent DNA helicase [Terriglobia bacterium]